MVITTLESIVKEKKWKTLQGAYRNLAKTSKNRPSESFLIQSLDNPSLWRIISIWKDMETLQKVRESGKTPTGILIFREAGAEPTLTIFDVKGIL